MLKNRLIQFLKLAHLLLLFSKNNNNKKMNKIKLTNCKLNNKLNKFNRLKLYKANNRIINKLTFNNDNNNSISKNSRVNIVLINLYINTIKAH